MHRQAQEERKKRKYKMDAAMQCSSSSLKRVKREYVHLYFQRTMDVHITNELHKLQFFLFLAKAHISLGCNHTVTTNQKRQDLYLRLE